MAKRNDGRTRLGRFSKGTSGNPKGSSRNRSDDWQNYFTGAGVFGKDKRVGTQFNLHVMSFDQLKDLWLGDDLAARAVETIPKEAMRQGYDIVISSSQDEDGDGVPDAGMDPAELAAEVTTKLDVLGADEYLEVVGGYERGYGGGALLIGANDGQEDLTKPLNLNRVRSIDWVTPLEARELMPMYAYGDPRAPKYGQPEIYQLTSRAVLPSYGGNYASTTMMIHESRLIVFPGIRVSRYQTTTARGGWGEAVLTRVFRVLRDFNTAWSSAGVLVSDFAQSVIKIAGLWESLALDGDKAFQNRLAAMDYGRSTINAVTIDAGDSYERQQTPLSGLPDLLEKFAVRLAAACDMPLTLLFGTSPAGMNATGESDVRFFYDRIAAYQKRKMEPALRRLCQIIFRTIGNKQEPDKWSVKFRPLWQDSAKDRAAATLTQAQADSAWITAGVLSAEEVALAHWGKGEYDPNITVDFEARDAQEAVTQAPVSQADINAMDPDHYSYVPPPEPGTLGPNGKAAAPDPNTKPVAIVRAEDSADAIREDQDRDEAGRFAGGGFGNPSPAQVAARVGHERMASDYARQVDHHASEARALHAQGETHARAGNWDKYQATSRKAIDHQRLAQHAMAKVAYHAERAGTEDARNYAAGAAVSMTRRDEWSDAAREAALEARRQSATAKSPEEHARRAAYASSQANGNKSKEKGVDRATAHGRAAALHEVAAQHNPEKAAEHQAKAAEHTAAAEKISNPGRRAPNAGAYAGEKPTEGKAERKTEPGEKGETIHASHGLTDLSGRAVGGQAHITQGENGEHHVRLIPTRNGEKFGAYGHASSTHPSLEAARAHAHEGLDKQRAHFLEKSKEVSGRTALAKHGGKAEAHGAAHEGKHGGQHEPHEKHGEKKGKGLLSKATELAKIAGETVAGEESAKLASQLSGGGGGEGGEE